MLFGAAVGAGFACFETAGYAYRMRLYGPQAMLSSIWMRGMLAPLMHVAWTAMVGAALWRVKGANPLSIKTFLDPKFYRVLLFAMILHMLWNFHRFDLQFYLKEIVLGAAAWFVIWGLVQQGLRQVRDDVRAAAVLGEPAFESAKAFLDNVRAILWNPILKEEALNRRTQIPFAEATPQ